MDDRDSVLSAFQALLDDSPEAAEQVVELTTLRKLCSRGIPSHPPHLRPLAYSLMLGILTPNKREWRQAKKRKRDEYHALVEETMSMIQDQKASSPQTLSDQTLLSIAFDVARLEQQHPVLQKKSTTPRSSPLRPPSRYVRAEREISDGSTSSENEHSGYKGKQRAISPLMTRRVIFDRLEDLAAARGPASAVPRQKDSEQTPLSPAVGPMLSPRITLSAENGMTSKSSGLASLAKTASLRTPQLSLSIPDQDIQDGADSSITLLSPKPIPIPGSSPYSASQASVYDPDTHAEVLIRLLTVFVAENPEIPYSSEWVEFAAALYLTLHPNVDPASRHTAGVFAEEQTYWILMTLITDLGGMMTEAGSTAALGRLGRRVCWADRHFWMVLCQNGLDPASSLYTHRWITTVLAHALPFGRIAKFLDVIFSEAASTPGCQPRLDALIDIGAAMVLAAKDDIFAAQTRSKASRRNLWEDRTDTYDVGDENEVNFARGLAFLNAYDLRRVGGEVAVLSVAFQIRQARLTAHLSGDDPDAPIGPTYAETRSIWTIVSDPVAVLRRGVASAEKSASNSSWFQSARSTWSTSTARSASLTSSKIAAMTGGLWSATSQSEDPKVPLQPETPVSGRSVPLDHQTCRDSSTSESFKATLAERLATISSSIVTPPGRTKLASMPSPGVKPLLLSEKARRASASQPRSGRGSSPSLEAEALSPSHNSYRPAFNLYRVGSRVPTQVARSSLLFDSETLEREDVSRALNYGEVPASASALLSIFQTRRRGAKLLMPVGLAVGLFSRGMATLKYPGHRPLNTAQSSLLAVGSGVVGVLDTSRGDLVATLSESTGSSFLPSLHSAMLKHPEGRQIMRERPIVSSKTVDLQALKSLRRGTLGREYVDWLERGNVTPDTREQVRYIDSPTLAYTMLRYRQTHDLYHTLFSLPPTLPHELTLKVVELSNMALPVAALSSSFGPLRLSPERRATWLQDWAPWALRVGKAGRGLAGVFWEKRWEQGLGELRRELGVFRNDGPGVESRWRGYRELREMERHARSRGEWIDEPEQW